LGLLDVIGHVTIGHSISGFLLAVYCDHASILHRYGDTGHQTYWGHDIGVTQHHRSRDYRTRRRLYSIGGQWWPRVYLAPLRRYVMC